MDTNEQNNYGKIMREVVTTSGKPQFQSYGNRRKALIIISTIQRFQRNGYLHIEGVTKSTSTHVKFASAHNLFNEKFSSAIKLSVDSC